MWVVPGECEGWCVTRAGHGDLGPHTPSRRALQRMLFPVVCYSALWQSSGDSQGRKKARQCVLEMQRCGLTFCGCSQQCTLQGSAQAPRELQRWSASLRGQRREGRTARECISCGFAISQNCKNTISSTSFQLSHSFPSFHERLFGLQNLSVQIKRIFVIQPYTGQLGLNTPSLLSPVSTLVGIGEEELFHWFTPMAEEKA